VTVYDIATKFSILMCLCTILICANQKWINSQTIVMCRLGLAQKYLQKIGLTASRIFMHGINYNVSLTPQIKEDT